MKNHDWYDITNIIILGVTLFALIIYTSLTAYQAYIARDTARRQLRAYVFIEGVNIKDIGSPSGPVTTVVVKNTGLTPAYKVTHTEGYNIVDWPLTQPLPSLADMSVLATGGDVQMMSRFDLGPNNVTGKSKRRKPIDPATGAGLVQGTKVLFLYGEILYTDTFGKHHYTRYKMMLGGPIADRGPNLATTEDGNESN
jgi:hypothetical protein